MKRILIPLAVAAGLLGPPAHAASTEDGIVAELREQGFARIEIRRTLLGRTRIIATSPGYDREIVLNPSTGVILRDFWRARDGVDERGRSNLVGGPALRGGDDRSSSGSGRDDNDDDNDDDDDDDNDSSGSGSGGDGGNSGSGSDDDDDGDSSGSGSSGGDDSDDDDD